MKFLAPGNSAKPEFPALLLHVAPQRFVKDLAEFQRARNYEISGPQKFCSGAEILALGRKFRPWGGISGPETEFPALEFSLLWVISSLSIAVPIPTLLHHQSRAIPVEFLQSSAQG
jgi:hypothetical protein